MVEVDNPYLVRIAQDWIAYYSSPEDTRDQDANLFNPWDIVVLLVNHNGDWAWNFVLLVLERDVVGKSLDILAAGPTEDLISLYGSVYIEAIEEGARSDGRFRSLLAGVWQTDIKQEIWDRIVAARGDAISF